MEDFVAWTRSEAFAEAQANRPPKEMFHGPLGQHTRPNCNFRSSMKLRVKASHRIRPSDLSERAVPVANANNAAPHNAVRPFRYMVDHVTQHQGPLTLQLVGSRLTNVE